MQPVLARARDLSCSDSPGCEPRHREYGDQVIVGEHRGCRMGSMVTMRGRIGSYSDRCRTIERGFGLCLSVVVVALPIGWFRTVLRYGASSGVGTLAERFSLDRSESQIEKLSNLDPAIVFTLGGELNPVHLTISECLRVLLCDSRGCGIALRLVIGSGLRRPGRFTKNFVWRLTQRLQPFSNLSRTLLMRSRSQPAVGQ
jgi:hypothetical protein